MSQPARSDGCPDTSQMGPWVLEEYMEASEAVTTQQGMDSTHLTPP